MPRRNGHYLASVRSDNQVTIMLGPNKGDAHNGGECGSSYSDNYASLHVSSCNESATSACIEDANATL